MINLIPNQEKKKKVKDFYFRLTVVSFSLLSFVTLVALVAVLPAYFLSSVKKNLAESWLTEQSAEPIPPVSQNIQVIIDGLNQKLRVIESARESKYPVSLKVVSEIMAKKLPEIKITQILYEVSAGENKKVSVRGIAQGREQLLLFRRALEDGAAFQKVDLPISNFVKGSNISFSLTLVPL